MWATLELLLASSTLIVVVAAPGQRRRELTRPPNRADRRERLLCEQDASGSNPVSPTAISTNPQIVCATRCGSIGFFYRPFAQDSLTTLDEKNCALEGLKHGAESHSGRKPLSHRLKVSGSLALSAETSSLGKNSAMGGLKVVTGKDVAN